jgi:long-subunit fatty acid transport protein
MDVTTPQSLNLEFQTGINPKTLVFGSVRWVDWSSFDLTPATYPGGSLVDYTDDRITYNLGVGRKLTDTLSAAVTVGYERNLHGDPSVLAPTDGFFSLGAGLTYTMGNTKISGGAKYIWIGDSTGAAGAFENNSAIGIGVNFSVAM